jgi:uncharacterized membrane protein
VLPDFSLIQVGALIAYLLVISATFKDIHWAEFKNTRRQQHLVFGSSAALFTLWLFKTGIHPGLDVHFLWLTALTLMLGFKFAMLSSFVVLVGVTLIGKESLVLFGINGLISITIPICLSFLVYTVTFHKLPRNFAVYIFICAFLTGAASITVKMFLLGGYFWVDNYYDWQIIKDNYLVLIPLLLFPEAMLNGMSMVCLVVYLPSWVLTFRDKFYFIKK